MKALIQRVLSSKLEINKKEYSKIERGFLVLLGITHDDTEEDMKAGFPAHTYGLFIGTTTTFSSDRSKLIITGTTGILKLEHILSIVD